MIKFKFHTYIVFILGFLVTSTVYAQSNEDILAEFNDKQAKIVDIVKRNKTNPELMLSELKTGLRTMINYNTFVYLVVGKKTYRQMSKSERADFISRFERGLFSMYSTVLIDNIDVAIDHYAIKDVNKSIKAVHSRIHTDSGTPYELQFFLRQGKKDRQWKVINLYIDGIDISKMFQQVFNTKLFEHNNDYKQVIQNWERYVINQ